MLLELVGGVLDAKRREVDELNFVPPTFPSHLRSDPQAAPRLSSRFSQRWKPPSLLL